MSVLVAFSVTPLGVSEGVGEIVAVAVEERQLVGQDFQGVATVEQ